MVVYSSWLVVYSSWLVETNCFPLPILTTYFHCFDKLTSEAAKSVVVLRKGEPIGHFMAVKAVHKDNDETICVKCVDSNDEPVILELSEIGRAYRISIGQVRAHFPAGKNWEQLQVCRYITIIMPRHHFIKCTPNPKNKTALCSSGDLGALLSNVACVCVRVFVSVLFSSLSFTRECVHLCLCMHAVHACCACLPSGVPTPHEHLRMQYAPSL